MYLVRVQYPHHFFVLEIPWNFRLDCLNFFFIIFINLFPRLIIFLSITFHFLYQLPKQIHCFFCNRVPANIGFRIFMLSNCTICYLLLACSKQAGPYCGRLPSVGYATIVQGVSYDRYFAWRIFITEFSFLSHFSFYSVFLNRCYGLSLDPRY